MEKRNFGKDKLIAPTDFTSPAVSYKIQDDLVPPSHFAMSGPSAGAHRGATVSGTASPISWINPSITSADPIPSNPWLAITQAQQEILELRKENQRIMMLQGDRIKGRIPVDHQSHHRARSAERGEQWHRWESEWYLETEKHKTEAARLKGQVEALKESAERHREEMRDLESTLNRQSHELEAMRGELCKANTELSQIRQELIHSSAQKEKISSQLERLKSESGEEIARLRRYVEKSKEEAQELALKAEMSRLQAEEAAKQQTLRLSEQLEEMQRRQEVELQQLNTSHCAELSAARKAESELKDKLQSMTSEVLQLKSTLMEASTERDKLKEHLSQMGQAFEAQSVTLHSLRNYIGQHAPEKGEKERLTEAVEKLNKEKAALQKTTELLTVRLNSVNEILALQEEKMMKKSSTDPLVKNGSEGLQVLQLWREKVFKLCIQLRSKDIELRGEKNKLLSQVRGMEQQLQQEQHRASLLQHSLDDKIAELDLERVEKETLKQDLAQADKEKSQVKSWSQNAEDELKTLTEAVRRFSLVFENKVAEVDAAQMRLSTFTQRLTFAKRQVETIEGLFLRRVALQKVQQASKQTEQAVDSITHLQTELSLACEERNKLTQELKRTPELIKKSLADLREQYESKLKQQQQELEQRSMEVQQAVAGREEMEQSLHQVQAQLEESKVNLEKLCSELLIQQEHSERALQERVSEIEDRCAEKLREMEVHVNTARREHTKAVMTLRQFEREAARKQDEMRESQHLGKQHRKKEVQNKQLKETKKDKSQLLASVDERGLISEYTRVHTAPLQSFAASSQQQTLSERSCSMGAKVQLPAESLLSVLEELHTLSAAVVNSSEDSAEEEGQNDSMGPPADSLHS
ncbi:coiled-coil alpha-helical rod protein 1 [Mastacembelus armatus]|uniref:Coiled-coil alpha-helical rod protein 1 n=1 Tax=Mastacembelus armatus TaxID=205130 RepID=A0A3Q3S995_9TELE|nr:coiled-coil alpha-helical rod protein 1 [Mastacembelus armatus]